MKTKNKNTRKNKTNKQNKQSKKITTERENEILNLLTHSIEVYNLNILDGLNKSLNNTHIIDDINTPKELKIETIEIEIKNIKEKLIITNQIISVVKKLDPFFLQPEYLQRKNDFDKFENEKIKKLIEKLEKLKR